MRHNIVQFFTYSAALLSKFARRFGDSLRDAQAVVDEINAVRRIIPEWERRIRTLDQDQLGVIQGAIDAMRAEIRRLSTEMAVAEGKMHEAGYTAETLVSRLATGAHLSMNENVLLLIEGDADGLAQYLNHTKVARKALGKVTQEQKMMLLEALLEDTNRKE